MDKLEKKESILLFNTLPLKVTISEVKIMNIEERKISLIEL
jgi:hypothetical protein|tara:strand:- start:370 stop:492 length:123 start_codon:yes stop_codon:yes gene_type:complete